MAVQRVDLHMHSPLSDGFWTPKTLPPAAAELGIEVLALTDHDEIAGVPEMTAACAAYNIGVIPGVEVSTLFEGVLYHLLLYGINLDDAALQEIFAGVRRHYNDVCRIAVEELARRGKPLDPEKSAPLHGEVVKVYHLVAVLIANGYAENMTKSYELCKEVGAQYDWTPPLEEALQLAHRAGGVGVLAHPGRAEPGFTAASAATLDRMRAAGLDGVECFHSYHSAANVAFYLTYAERHGMLIGAGSDSHGPGTGPRPLTAWPAVQCRALLERCGFAVAG